MLSKFKTQETRKNTYVNYSLPFNNQSDQLHPVANVDTVMLTTYGKGSEIKSASVLTTLQEKDASVVGDFPVFDPIHMYRGVGYFIPKAASKQAGFLYMHVKPSADLSFVELRGLDDIVVDGSYVEITVNGSKKVPAILYCDRTNFDEDGILVVRVFFEKGTFDKGGTLELHLANNLNYGLRMNFVNTFGDYVTQFQKEL